MKWLFDMILVVIMTTCTAGNGYSQDEISMGRFHLVHSQYENGFVGGINAFSFEKFYQSFEMKRAVSGSYWGRMYYLQRSQDNLNILLRVGVYPSVEMAEQNALEYLNQTAAVFEESKEIKVGDNCWINTVAFVGDAKPRLNAIVFLRKNVLLLIGSGAEKSNGYIDILPIAQEIDGLLVNGSPDVSLVNNITPPVVESIQISKCELREGETLPITVIASDPNGKALEYVRGPGILISNGKENEFLIRASKANISEPFYGTHTFEVWVVNDENLFSQKKQFQITF